MNPKALFLLATAALLIGGCSDSGQNHAPAQVSERAKREQAELVELASRQHACVDWMKSLPDRGMGKVFTVDVKKALVRTNGQPVIMVAELEDVSERNGVFTALFEMLPFLPFNSRNYLSLRLSLRCSSQQAEDLLHAKPEPDILGVRFAVVARIESVSRPAPGATAPEDEDTLSADGLCVDLLRLQSAAKK